MFSHDKSDCLKALKATLASSSSHGFFPHSGGPCLWVAVISALGATSHTMIPNENLVILGPKSPGYLLFFEGGAGKCNFTQGKTRK